MPGPVLAFAFNPTYSSALSIRFECIQSIKELSPFTPQDHPHPPCSPHPPLLHASLSTLTHHHRNCYAVTMRGASNDPMDEIAVAVLADADSAWDASTPPSSPCGSKSPLGWQDDTQLLSMPPPLQLPAPPTQRPKQYKKATPSRFCHVCGRKSANIRVAICGRIARGLCRKVICELCFKRYGWDATNLLDAPPNPCWQCPHCTGMCVPKAQCNTYKRTNLKRHLALRERRCYRQTEGSPCTSSSSSPMHSHARQSEGSQVTADSRTSSRSK